MLLLFGLPLALAGGVLWFAMQHQGTGGGYSAAVAPVRTNGHAIVVPDVDGLLRREAPFTRSEQTTLQVTAQTVSGQPVFVGLAPAAELGRYLARVPYARVQQVRLARGPLPVSTVAVGGTDEPVGPPASQSFWVASSNTGSLEWSPYQRRGEQLALVMMTPDAAAPLAIEATVQVNPQWLASAAYGLLALGSVLVVVAVAVLAWPGRPREVVYVVPPGQLPELAATLGVPVPRGADGAWADPVPAIGAGTAADRPAPVAAGHPVANSPAVTGSTLDRPAVDGVAANGVGANGVGANGVAANGVAAIELAAANPAMGSTASASAILERSAMDAPADLDESGNDPTGVDRGEDTAAAVGVEIVDPAGTAHDPVPGTAAGPFQWPPATSAGYRTAIPVSVPPVVTVGGWPGHADPDLAERGQPASPPGFSQSRAADPASSSPSVG